MNKKNHEQLQSRQLPSPSTLKEVFVIAEESVRRMFKTEEKNIFSRKPALAGENFMNNMKGKNSLTRLYTLVPLSFVIA